MPVVVPRGLGGMLRKRRFESVLEVAEGETLAIGALEIRASLPCTTASRSPIGAVGEPRRLRHLGLEVDLLRRRHGPLRRNGRARIRRRRAHSDLGLGP